MTIQEFIQTWTNKPCDFDHGGTYECVDLIRQWIQDGLGMPGYSLHALGNYGSAKDLYNNFNLTDSKSFIRIQNLTNPNNMPNQGDIVVFRNSTWFPFLFGWRGHTGIVVGSGPMKMLVFSQNYPTGHLPQLMTFSYKDCLGWIRKR